MCSHIITIEHKAHSARSPQSAKLRAWANAALNSAKLKTPHEVCIHVITTPEIQRMNHRFRNKNKPTNVLSFPTELPDNIPISPKPLGDILVSASYVNREARQQNKSNDAHWAHMIIHSTLHLLGFDHKTSSEAHHMEQLEIKLLSKLGFPDPYNNEDE